MPQRSGDRDKLAERDPDERWSAVCPVDAIELLLRFDHHVVWLEGRAAVLLTYAWHEVADCSAPLRLEVSFTFAPGHPLAPAEVQAVARSLNWQSVQVRGGAS